MPAPKSEFNHRGGHDLECLLNTMLAICHYTVGPGGQLRKPIPGDENIKLNEWFTIHNRVGLAASKSTTLEAFKTFVEPALPEYWKDFSPYLQCLIKATWDTMPYLEKPNIATYKSYQIILEEALAYYTHNKGERPSVYASVPNTKHTLEDAQGRSESPKKAKHIHRVAATTFPTINSWVDMADSNA